MDQGYEKKGKTQKGGVVSLCQCNQVVQARVEGGHGKETSMSEPDRRDKMAGRHFIPSMVCL